MRLINKILCHFCKHWLICPYCGRYEKGGRRGIDMTYTKTQYKRAFEIACDLLNGGNLYGIDADELFTLIMQEQGMVSSLDYQKFILKNLDRFSDNDEVRHNAIEKGGRE